MGIQTAYPTTTSGASTEKNKQITFFVESLGESYDERDFFEKIQSHYPVSSTLRYRLSDESVLRAWFSAEVVKTARQVDISSSLGRIAAKWKEGHIFAKRIEEHCVGKGININSNLVLHSGLSQLSQLFGGISYFPLGYVESLYHFYNKLSHTKNTDPSILRALFCHTLFVVHKLELAEAMYSELNIALSSCLKYFPNNNEPLLFFLLRAPNDISKFVLRVLIEEIERGDMGILQMKNPLYKNIPLVSCAIALGQFEIAKNIYKLYMALRNEKLTRLDKQKINPIQLGVELRRKHHSFGERQDLQFMIGAYVACDESYEKILREQAGKLDYVESDYFTEEQKRMFDCGQVSFEWILKKIKK